MKTKRPSKARRLSSNTISTLPQTIIENILCLLPIQEAARTSILSREWRYKWTTIPKLAFYSWTFSKRTTEEKQPSDTARARKNMDQRCKLFIAIYQVLLMRLGPIHEFTFYADPRCNCLELDHIIFHLSRNHAVKKLTLRFDEQNLYKLPLCAFSLHQLTDLHLQFVNIDHQTISSGFGSLRSLHLMDIKISTKALLHLLSNCPSLERFSLKWLVLDSVPEELPTLLVHLRYFCFNDMSLNDSYHLTFLVVLIKCSPNLEKIELLAETGDRNDEEICSGILEGYSDVLLEHLKELVIYFFDNSKPSMEFVKFILARSPKLKKLGICNVAEKDKEPDILKVLLQAPRASPVEILWSSWEGNIKTTISLKI